MAYQYSPLDTTKREIRLLEILENPFDDRNGVGGIDNRNSRSLLKVKSILSSTGKRLGVSPSRPPPLECRIVHISLDNTDLDYETVSYCWGESTPNRPIKIAGRELMVPTNTDRALRRIASGLGSGEQSRKVWIDAVCVNQVDDGERAHQVALMRHIYAGGQQNLIYLGERGKLITRAIDNVLELIEEVRTDVAAHRGSFASLLAPSTGAWRRATTPMRTNLDEEALCKLWSLPWFSRVWVFQEQALSKSNICHAGSLQINLEIILKVSTWLMNYHLTHIPAKFTEIPGFRAAADMWLIRSDYIEHGRTDIYNAMGLGQGLGARDKRDKIFGLLGLLGEQGDSRELLIPDYTKSYQQVLRDAMRFALIHSQSPISPLSSITHRDETQLYDPDMPSWVFSGEWNGETTASSLPRPSDTPKQHTPSSTAEELDPARAALLNPRNANILTMKGYVIDTIRGITPLFPTREDMTKNPLVLPEWFDACELLMPHPLPGSTTLESDREDRLIRTLIADVSALGTKSTWRDRQGFYSLLQHVLSKGSVLDVRDLGLSDNDSNSDAGAKQAAMFWRALGKCSHRRFAVCQSGFVALVPRITRVGDLVVKVGVADFPVVVRMRTAQEGRAQQQGGNGQRVNEQGGNSQRVNGQGVNGQGGVGVGESWWLIGEAYVDGVMEWQEGWYALQVWMTTQRERGFEIW